MQETVVKETSNHRGSIVRVLMRMMMLCLFLHRTKRLTLGYQGMIVRIQRSETEERGLLSEGGTLSLSCLQYL